MNAWTAVDRYFEETLLAPDPALEAALEAARVAGLPPHDVSPLQGKLLELLARLMNARRILEIGTLAGYSTICLARSGARVVTLEANAHHAAIARRNIERASLSDRVEIVVGPALETLPTLDPPFDLVFIDADKANNARYLEASLRLARKGTLIVADNVVRDGAVLDATSADPSVQGVRAFHELLARTPRLSATAVQTVGVKGYDGFTIALVAE